MEYTILKLSQLAGVSSRTLRYYDEIGLLKPARVNSSGYRIYGPREVDRLQHILFYRELGFSLDVIRKLLTSPTFDEAEALYDHREKLLEERERLDLLIQNVENTIASKEGKTPMSDQDKFKGLKQKMMDDNEKTYGEEIRRKYGEERVNQSNAKLQNMTAEEYEHVTQLEGLIKETLSEAMETGNPSADLAQKAVDLHKQWLSFYWESYSKEAHAGLADMYVADERFKAYYDEIQPGAAEFLRAAIYIYTARKN
ncbi:MAG TPA: MerR family transcriptional regulator [Candidatus Angelobacter sp.]|nr:MerR family transcriptional regulator [Candidatus Angelobacter sp.]